MSRGTGFACLLATSECIKLDVLHGVSHVSPALLLDLPVESSTIIESIHREPNYAKYGWLAVGGLAAYAGYRYLRNRYSQRLNHTQYDALHEEVAALLEVNDEPVDPEEPVETTLEDGSVEVVVRRPRKRSHRKHRFITDCIHKTKAHFGGCPKFTESNQIAVSRHVYELCKERKCLPHQTRTIMAVAVPAVFSPDDLDVSSAQAYNIGLRRERRSMVQKAMEGPRWYEGLLDNPLDAVAWREAMDWLFGLPSWKAIRVVK